MIIISSAQHCQIYRDPLFQQPDSDCEQNLIRKTQEPPFPQNGPLGFSSMPTQLVADQFSSNCYGHTHETPKRRVCSFSFFWRGMQQCQEGVRGGGGRGVGSLFTVTATGSTSNAVRRFVLPAQQEKLPTVP